VEVRGDWLEFDDETNQKLEAKYLQIKLAPVVLSKHVIIGSGSVILPGVHVGIGSSVGALSLVTKSLQEWGIYLGVPAKKIKNRGRNLLELEKELEFETSLRF
jgi:galactoside O-acetyltransferase